MGQFKLLGKNDVFNLEDSSDKDYSQYDLKYPTDSAAANAMAAGTAVANTVLSYAQSNYINSLPNNFSAYLYYNEHPNEVIDVLGVSMINQSTVDLHVISISLPNQNYALVPTSSDYLQTINPRTATSISFPLGPVPTAHPSGLLGNPLKVNVNYRNYGSDLPFLKMSYTISVADRSPHYFNIMQ
jgi:hypothetical protein